MRVPVPKSRAESSKHRKSWLVVLASHSVLARPWLQKLRWKLFPVEKQRIRERGASLTDGRQGNTRSTEHVSLPMSQTNSEIVSFLRRNEMIYLFAHTNECRELANLVQDNACSPSTRARIGYFARSPCRFGTTLV